MEVLAAKRQHSAALLDEAAGKRQRASSDAPGYLPSLSLASMDCSLPTQGLWSLPHGTCDYNDSDVDEDDEVGGAPAACDFLWPAPTAVGSTKLQPAAYLPQPDLRPSHCGTELHFTMPPLGAQGLQHTPPATPRAPASAAACSSQMPAKQNPFAWTVDSPLPPSAAPAAQQQHLHNLLGFASPAQHAATPPAILTTAAADCQFFSQESYPSTPTGAGIPARRSPPPAPLRRGAKAFLQQDDIPSAGASSFINNLLDDDWFGGAAQPGMRNSGSGCGLAWLDGGGSAAPRARSLSRSSSSESLSSASGGSIMSAVMAALPRGPAPAPDRASMPPPPPVSRRLFDDSFLNNVQSVHAPRPTPPPGISPWLYDMLRPAELQQEQQALLNQQQGAAAEQ